jgi:hypothetical protein
MFDKQLGDVSEDGQFLITNCNAWRNSIIAALLCTVVSNGDLLTTDWASLGQLCAKAN